MSGRWGWLDGLRAVAVLLVLYAHLTRYVFTDLRAVTGEWLHAGPAGVMLFFLVSGYIIPASLERHGDLRAFWISRALRLYPMYLVAIAAVVALGGYSSSQPVTAAVGHMTMLPFLLDVPLVTAVLWTLSYEMAFYLLVTSLFTVRLHRASGPIAVLLAVLGVATAPLAGPVPGLVWPVTAVIVIGLGLVVSRRRVAVVAGGVLLGGLVVTLLAIGQDPAHGWDGLLVVAVMFTGTAIYRADRGQTGWWPAILAIVLVGTALLVNWVAELHSLGAVTPTYVARSVITLLTFGGAFAIGRLSRERRTPGWLSLIGVWSYSIYLVHYVLIQIGHQFLESGLPDPLVAAGYLAAVLGISWLTHRYVEVPTQRLGRRFRAGRPRPGQDGVEESARPKEALWHG
ncbi:acyltransferase [Actinoplanes sp. L3-i22]|uniref:acyltransferase family protein n=1 Tax=Actinoplanes sp. L3-i22 TaxID=2836373 RepID=UPI001C7817CC|nr:acyltransferase [Actinoplanes sp. L3-i22]BCY07877.1 acyltransferase [Actinoplanes sp. L3-i22]